MRLLKLQLKSEKECYSNPETGLWLLVHRIALMMTFSFSLSLKNNNNALSLNEIVVLGSGRWRKQSILNPLDLM